MRDFEKISFEQFKKDVCDNKEMYENYPLPKRSSKYTAGYDIYLLEDISIAPHEIKKIPTGIKARYESDEVLLLIVRSSMGFKYNIRLCNQVGVIDADYYNNPQNEGHMWIKIQNEGDSTVNFSKGTGIVQGLFLKYLTTDSDNHSDKQREGWHSQKNI